MNSQKSTNDKDLFARLDELEEQERTNNEIDNINDEHTIDGAVNLNVDKNVKWKENMVEEKEIETVAVPKVEKATIKFSHSTEKVSKQFAPILLK